mgnify:CR=1 FL=1
MSVCVSASPTPRNEVTTAIQSNDFWPHAISGAVSLTFDDGLPSQIDHALPLLDSCEIKGTFYVNPGRGEWASRSSRWRQAGESGHEIGNHTTRHPCSCNFRFDTDYCLEHLTLDDLAATIDDAERQLDELLPVQTGKRSFCYPCYQSDVGAGRSRRSYVPLVADRFRAARGGGERPNDPLLVDLSYLSAESVEGQPAERMISYIERGVAEGRWAILCMHGIGGEHLSIEVDAFERVVQHLHRNRQRIWTGTVIEVADHILVRRKDPGDKRVRA